MDATSLTNLDIFAASNDTKILEPVLDNTVSKNSCSTTFHKRQRQNPDTALKSAQLSIMQVLDSTSTAFGHRLLRKWICFPITAQKSIEGEISALNRLRERQDCV